MKKILLASFVVSLLLFSSMVSAQELTVPAENTWEKQSATSTENQDNMVSGGKAIAGAVFVVVFTVLMLTIRTTRPVTLELMYQA